MTISIESPLTNTRFSWVQAIRQLLVRQEFPPGWARAAVVVYVVNAVIIAGCIAVGVYFFHNAAREFGERNAGTLASVAALASSGVVCFKIRNRLRGSSLASFWAVFGGLMLFAAADDLLMVHERIDKIIHALLKRDPWDTVTDHLDDMIVAFYALPAFYQGWIHRRRLIEARLTVQILAVAFAIFAVHVAFDVAGWSETIEESLKLTAGCTILVAFLATYYLPVFPASWIDSKARLTNDELAAADSGSVASATFDEAWPWVRLCAAAVFIMMAVALVAMLFALAAAHRHGGDSTGKMFSAFGIFALGAAAGLFWAGHFISVYATRLRRSDFVAAGSSGRLAAPAHLAAWRSVTLGLIGGTMLLCVSAVWASRHFAPAVPKHIFGLAKHKSE